MVKSSSCRDLLPNILRAVDSLSAENLALFSAALMIVVNGCCKDSKLVIRRGISEKKGNQCLFAQDTRCSSSAVFSADSMRFLRCMRDDVAHGVYFSQRLNLFITIKSTARID